MVMYLGQQRIRTYSQDFEALTVSVTKIIMKKCLTMKVLA